MRRGWAIIEQVETVARELRNATLTGLTDDEIRGATRVLELSATTSRASPGHGDQR
jgi:hypothetical protein